MAFIWDFDVDLTQFDVAKEGEGEMLLRRLQKLYRGQCRAAVTAAVGSQRDDIGVEASFPMDRARAVGNIDRYGAVRVGC